MIKTIINLDLSEDVFQLDKDAGEEYNAEFFWIPIRDGIEKDLEKYHADLVEYSGIKRTETGDIPKDYICRRSLGLNDESKNPHSGCNKGSRKI